MRLWAGFCLLAIARIAVGQEAPGAASKGTKPGPPKSVTYLEPGIHSIKTHAFWDRTNLGLFGGVAAVRAMDYASTRHFRARGANEILLSNATVDNKPLFAGIEVAGAAASIAVSYAFHRTGHHKIERWISIVHIGVGTFGDARNYTLSGPNPNP